MPRGCELTHVGRRARDSKGSGNCGGFEGLVMEDAPSTVGLMVEEGVRSACHSGWYAIRFGLC